MTQAERQKVRLHICGLRLNFKKTGYMASDIQTDHSVRNNEPLCKVAIFRYLKMYVSSEGRAHGDVDELVKTIRKMLGVAANTLNPLRT